MRMQTPLELRQPSAHGPTRGRGAAAPCAILPSGPAEEPRGASVVRVPVSCCKSSVGGGNSLIGLCASQLLRSSAKQICLGRAREMV